MKQVAVVLLVGVMVANNGPRWLAGDYSMAAWWYIMQSLWVIALAACLLPSLRTQRGIWRDLGVAAVGIAIAEAGQAAGCRLAVGPSIAGKPEGLGLCDWWTGEPVAAWSTVIYLLVLSWIVGRWAWDRTDGATRWV